MPINLVTTNLNSQFLYPELSKILLSKDIIVEIFNENKKYHDDVVFSIAGEIRSEEYKKFLNHRIIVEYQGESNSGKHGKYFIPNQKNILFLYGSYKNSEASNIIFYPRFFWHDLAIDYLRRKYDRYKPNKTYRKKFLMPIRNWKGQAKWRRAVFDQLTEFLPESLYSMFQDGIHLPGSHQNSDRREINFSWFDDTFFSLILESYYVQDKPIFCTEKTYKPLAFCHPFQIISNPNFLQSLKNDGFETFDNLFDESYDKIADIDEKIKIIKKNILEYDYVPYTKETYEKLYYNQNHFYDLKNILNSIEQDFLNPIIKWLN